LCQTRKENQITWNRFLCNSDVLWCWDKNTYESYKLEKMSFLSLLKLLCSKLEVWLWELRVWRIEGSWRVWSCSLLFGLMMWLFILFFIKRFVWLNNNLFWVNDEGWIFFEEKADPVWLWIGKFHLKKYSYLCGHLRDFSFPLQRNKEISRFASNKRPQNLFWINKKSTFFEKLKFLLLFFKWIP